MLLTWATSIGVVPPCKLSGHSSSGYLRVNRGQSVHGKTAPMLGTQANILLAPGCQELESFLHEHHVSLLAVHSTMLRIHASYILTTFRQRVIHYHTEADSSEAATNDYRNTNTHLALGWRIILLTRTFCTSSLDFAGPGRRCAPIHTYNVKRGVLRSHAACYGIIIDR